jgi:hypothetical protein
MNYFCGSFKISITRAYFVCKSFKWLGLIPCSEKELFEEMKSWKFSIANGNLTWSATTFETEWGNIIDTGFERRFERRFKRRYVRQFIECFLSGHLKKVQLIINHFYRCEMCSVSVTIRSILVTNLQCKAFKWENVNLVQFLNKAFHVS